MKPCTRKKNRKHVISNTISKSSKTPPSGMIVLRIETRTYACSVPVYT